MAGQELRQLGPRKLAIAAAPQSPQKHRQLEAEAAAHAWHRPDSPGPVRLQDDVATTGTEDAEHLGQGALAIGQQVQKAVMGQDIEAGIAQRQLHDVGAQQRNVGPGQL